MRMRMRHRKRSEQCTEEKNTFLRCEALMNYELRISNYQLNVYEFFW